MAASAHAQDGAQARSLFVGGDGKIQTQSTLQQTQPGKDAISPQPSQAGKGQTTPKYLGANYFIRLIHPDGKTQDVLASRKFKSGERFQLALKVNRPAYIYVANEDPSGKLTPIYPKPGTDHFVNAMGTVIVPAKGSFEFDRNPGLENLLVLISPQSARESAPDRMKTLTPDAESGVSAAVLATCQVRPMEILKPAPAPVTTIGPSLVADGSTRGINLSEPKDCVEAEGLPAPTVVASRGIVVSDDEVPVSGQTVSHTVVKKIDKKDEPLLLKIKLFHQ